MNDQAAASGSERKRHALALFAGLPKHYDRVAAVLSFGQDLRWRRTMVGMIRAEPGDRVLDVATGTGMVAEAVVRRYGCSVVGLDQSAAMLEGARARLQRDEALARRISLVAGEAERLPFADGEFDHLTFTYLLRYVDSPAATLRELARVVRPGGRIASLEFAVPPSPLWHALWSAYVRVGLPTLGRLVSREWRETGSFLARSIPEFYAHHPLEQVARYWTEAGIDSVQVKTMSLGGGVVMSENEPMAAPNRLERPAFYALRPGGMRDLVTLLHPPYTAWHLSYVVFGAVAAPMPHGDRLAATLIAFLLAMGVAAHALDELQGRPLRTQLSDRTLIGLASVSLVGAMAIGVVFAATVSLGLVPFIAVGAFLVVAYNLELFRGRFHTGFWFAAGWGAFPALTGYWINALAFRPAGILVTAGCFMLSVVQRQLSAPVRELRRRTVSVSGRQHLADGKVIELDARRLAAPLESGLQACALGLVLLAAGLAIVRL